MEFHCVMLLLFFLSHRPYFELKAKYYMQLEVCVAFGFVGNGIFMQSPTFCDTFKYLICYKRRVERHSLLSFQASKWACVVSDVLYIC